MSLRGKSGQDQRSTRASLNRYYSGGTPKVKPSSPFQPKLPVKPKKRIVAKIADYLIILLIGVAIVYNLLIQFPPQVQASSYIYHPKRAYLAAATQSVSGFKDKTKLTFNEQAVAKDLKAKFPEISTASVQLPLIGRQPKVKLQISPPAYYINSAGQSYILALDGVVVAKASQQPQIKKLVTINDQSNFKLTVGSTALASSNINFINTIISQSQHAGVSVKSLTLPAIAQELDLRTTDQPYYVKFYLGGNALTQVGQFLASRHQFSQNHIQPSEYLDVRVEGKVSYK